MSRETLADLKRLVEAKHGEAMAYVIASRYGSTKSKNAWRQALATPVDAVAELDHKLWRQSLRTKFSGLPPVDGGVS